MESQSSHSQNGRLSSSPPSFPPAPILVHRHGWFGAFHSESWSSYREKVGHILQMFNNPLHTPWTTEQYGCRYILSGLQKICLTLRETLWNVSHNRTGVQSRRVRTAKCFPGHGTRLKAAISPHQVNFQFNPPSAPHFGRSWEREIKSVKMALYVALGKQSTTDTNLHTVLVEVEGILNSKPLGYVSSDLADTDPVTPNMLLMGRPDSSLPQAIHSSRELHGRRKWHHSQILADHFWTAFIWHYLPKLQTRKKWKSDKVNLDSSQVVLIVDSQYPRPSWPIKRITEIYPGKDGKVRSASSSKVGSTYSLFQD